MLCLAWSALAWPGLAWLCVAILRARARDDLCSCLSLCVCLSASVRVCVCVFVLRTRAVLPYGQRDVHINLECALPLRHVADQQYNNGYFAVKIRRPHTLTHSQTDRQQTGCRPPRSQEVSTVLKATTTTTTTVGAGQNIQQQ